MTLSSLAPSPQKSSPSIIRMIPEFNIAALNQGKDIELMFWYCLRASDTTGCGHVYLMQALDYFTRCFGYSERTFYRHLAMGRGKLWSLYENQGATIQIWGAETAFRYLGITAATRHVEIDVKTLLRYPRKSLLWNTGAYRPFGTGRSNHPISRQSLAGVTGIEKRKQQRYDKSADTPLSENLLKEKDLVTKKVYQSIRWVSSKAAGKLIPVKDQLGNTYFSHATRSNRGQLKKLSKLVAERKGSLLCAEAPDKSKIPARRFYDTFRDFIRAKSRGLADSFNSFYPSRNLGYYIQVNPDGYQL